MEQQDTVLNGRYRLGEVLGEGGMAVVYRAQDLLLNRAVAVKVLRRQYATDEGFLRRFEREAQAAARFSHPNIVNVYDVGTDGDRHYIVQEYIRGPNLKELIRRQGPFSVDGAVFIIGQVASALDYAHQHGLVHRDIKPQNILVDRDGNAKVVDFGIAKGAQDVNLTEAGTGMGTVHYVSPEQARGEPATPSSDLYSTGVVLFEMLTKRLPFEADTPVGVAMQHVNTPAPAPSTHNPAIPPAVDAIVLKALAKDPTQRYPSGSALAGALRHWKLPVRPPVPAGDKTRTAPQTQAPLPPGRRSARPAEQPLVVRGSGSVRQQTGQLTTRPATGRRDVRAYRGYQAPETRANRDDVGCATWLIGSAILLTIVGLIMLAFRAGPGIFAADLEPTVTPRPSGATTLPTPTPTPPPPTGPTVTLPSAAPTTAPLPTATVTPTPTVDAAPAVAQVPALAGMTQAEAASALGDSWTLEASEQSSDDVPAGLVISQQPPAGTMHPVGDIVSIVVSSGPAAVAIPDVSGMEASAARAQLEALGFVVERAEEESDAVAPGTVIRTEPSGSAPAGSTVTMVVRSAAMAVVPYVYGMDYQEAVAEMEAAGLTVGNVAPLSCARVRQLVDATFDCDGFPAGGILTSTLGWGTSVPAGSPVDLTYYSPAQ
ncbi:MAG TPA: protein kinase [Thermomicrobiales bacterium]|nr:protein kinase [Thermomicrobiales bacterium]